jgi:Domain of unknown function (DUF4184)
MPLTFPSHQALVLPFKARWPHSFDGVALCIGSMAPDLSYAFLPLRINVHNVVGLFTWSLPITLGLMPITKNLFLPWLASAHPALAPLRQAGSEQTTLIRSCVCALIGSASHVLWDGFSLPEGTFPQRFSAFSSITYEQEPWRGRFLAISVASSVIGAAVTFGAARILWKRLTNLKAHALRDAAKSRVDLLVTALFALAIFAASLEYGKSCAAMRATWVQFTLFSLLALFRHRIRQPG